MALFLDQKMSHPKKLKTVAFHSTKGGVGRTSALMNFAKLMCAKGHNVLILELDFDAPGLAFKYGSDLPQDAGSQSSGYVDYLSFFNKIGADGSDLTERSNIFSNGEIKKRKIEFLHRASLVVAPHTFEIEDNTEISLGEIRVICAGLDDQDYWLKLSSHWFHEIFSISQNEYSADGDFLLHKNREFFVNELEVYSQVPFSDDKTADYLLVDCRSAREFSSAPLYYWADVVVHMFPNNAEGFVGADRMMRAFESCHQKKDAVFLLVGSRMPRPQVLSARQSKDAPPNAEKNDANKGFLPVTTFGRLLDNYLEREGKSLNGLKSHIRHIKENELVLVVQEAINATMGESYLLNPQRHLDPSSGTYGSHCHTVANDYARIFHRILFELKDAEEEPPMTGPIREETDLAKIVGDFLPEQRSDLYMMLDRKGQAFNTDGNQNVLLRNESVQVLIQTLEAKVVRTFEGSLGEFVGLRQDALQSFFDSGLQVGLGFGIKSVWGRVVESRKVDAAVLNLDFEFLVKEWCRFDGKDAAFGVMHPEFLKNEECELTLEWTKPFLATQLDEPSNQSKLFISTAAKKFLCGYALGNVIAYKNATRVAESFPDGAEVSANPVDAKIINSLAPENGEACVLLNQPKKGFSIGEPVLEGEHSGSEGYFCQSDKFLLAFSIPAI